MKYGLIVEGGVAVILTPTSLFLNDVSVPATAVAAVLSVMLLLPVRTVVPALATAGGGNSIHFE